MTALTIKELNVWFGTDRDRVDAVKSASFDVGIGESFGLVGKSGSGKSTILRAITGLAPMWSGEITVEGKLIQRATRDRAFYKTVQMVFQDPYASLHPRHTVDQVLSETLHLNGFKDINTRVVRVVGRRWSGRQVPFPLSASDIGWPTTARGRRARTGRRTEHFAIR